MPPAPVLRFCLEAGLRASAEAGQHNFLGLVSDVARAAGWNVEYAEPEAAARTDAYSLLHMREPPHDRALTLRRTITYPFWKIERTNVRWDWDVARARYDPEVVTTAVAEKFSAFWRKRLLDARESGWSGHVFVPLQGRLLEHRSFQTMSPIAMLQALLEHERQRPIVVSLHPNETYDRDDRAALDRLIETSGRITLGRVPSDRLMAGCDYVATQNSNLGFLGYLLAKPCVMFARSDFHHIALDTARLGVAEAVRRAQQPEPTGHYAAYVWWFLQVQAINAGRDDAAERIANRLRALGWPL